MSQASLSLEKVSLSFEDQEVLSEISLSLSRGKILVLLGPSGAGKTSLLRLMAGLIAPDRGSVRLNGLPPRGGSGTGLVFQSYRLLPWKSVSENIAFALPHLKESARKARVAELLAQVGLSAMADAWAASLSGGMQQRVALARALAAKPDFLLMDEPFAALDAQTRALMQEDLLALAAEVDAPGIVFVTHSVDEALLLADEIVVLSTRPAKIVQNLTPPWPKGENPIHHPAWASLRESLWQSLRHAVLSDPRSEFYRP